MTLTGETHLHPGLVVRMKGRKGDEQSQAEFRAGFGTDPGIVKFRLKDCDLAVVMN